MYIEVTISASQRLRQVQSADPEKHNEYDIGLQIY